MRVPMTFSLYMARHFFWSIIATLAAITAIVGLIELIELVRRVSEHNSRDISIWLLMELVLLKMPSTLEKIYPFAFLIGGMVTLSKLTRTSELVAARAAGVSVWQFLWPGLLVALLLGAFFVGMVNPIGASMIARYDKMEGRYITGKPSTLSVSPSGVWLRQVAHAPLKFLEQDVSEYIFYARRMDQTDLRMHEVIVFFYNMKHGFIGRLDAASAVLQPGMWEIEGTQLALPGMIPETQPLYRIATDLTREQIQESFAAPETVSFWGLPGFIAVLEQAGFSALRHTLHWHSLAALPLLLMGMVLLAAVFSMRQVRRGGAGLLVATGVMVGFFYHFLAQIIYAMGASGSLPAFLAGWAPSLAVCAMGVAALLHLEDG